VVVGRFWPGNRNDIVVARHTLAHLITGGRRVTLGDGGHREIATITTPRHDTTARIIGDQHWRVHPRIPARVQHLIARLKDQQILRQCRRGGNAINHTLQIIAGLCNLKTHTQLRVKS